MSKLKPLSDERFVPELTTGAAAWKSAKSSSSAFDWLEVNCCCGWIWGGFIVCCVWDGRRGCWQLGGTELESVTMGQIVDIIIIEWKKGWLPSSGRKIKKSE